VVNLRRKFYVTLVHPLISVLVPFILLHSLLLALANFFIKSAGIQVFPPFYWLILLLAGFAETTIANYLYQERNTGAAPRLREVVFVILGGALLIITFNGDLFRWDIDPKRISFWLPLLFVPVQWILTFYVHGKLRYRELFLQFFEGKDESEVFRVYQDFNHEASESYQQMRILKHLIIGFMIVIFVAWATIEWGMQPDFGFYERGSLFLGLVVYLIITYAINGFGNLQQVMMEGYIIPQAQRRRRWFIIFIIIGAILLIILPFVGKEAPLPEQYLVDAFYWISDRLTLDEVEGRPQELRFGSQAPRMPDLQVFDMLAEQGESKRVDLRWLMRLIGWNLLGLLVLAVIIFLIYPLFKGFKRGERPTDIIKNGFRTLMQNLSESLAAVKDSFTQFLEARRERAIERERDRKRAQEEKQRQKTGVEAALPKARSRRERRFYTRIVKSYLKFAKWGEQKGVPFARSLGPLEYAGMVGTAVPESDAYCSNIGEMFEEIQFSGRAPSSELTQRYLKSVKDITKKF
jgi:hypothetical protein